jgi:hypothetical protein
MIKFNLGQTVATPNALATLSNLNVNPASLLRRHASGDWGDMCAEDKAANDHAVASGESRIFSSYDLTPTTKVWIITEWDRSVTTILCPEDY